MMNSLVILVSGRGSNLQAMIDARLPVRATTIISNRSGAPALDVAKRNGLETRVVDQRSYPDRKTFDAALGETVRACEPDLVVLAGFMHLLEEDFVQRYEGRLMNIHPSLLPAFPGLHPHRKALLEGVKIHGCTVHFVTPRMDHGPIVVQAAVGVMPDDTEDSLSARVLQQEHRIYPQAVRWFMEGRLKLSDNRVSVTHAALDDSVLYSPGLCK
jgi:phosphoribosylglycinamide formyltransferase-1